MAPFLLRPATRNTIVVGFLDPYGIPTISVQGVPVHSNIFQYIVYEISKLWQLQYWDNWDLTNMTDWEIIDLISFKRARYTTTVHVAQFITKLMSNNLSTMTILQRKGYATTNLRPRCGLDPDTILHMYQFTHKGSRGRWTASVEALRKCLEDRNMDPDIAIILSDTLLYIAGEINDLPQCPNITLHSDILPIS